MVRLPERELSDLVLPLAAPLIESLGPTPEADDVQATVGLAIDLWNALTRSVTSNIELSDWRRYLGDATLTATILDRIVMNVLRFNSDGPSYRQHVAAQRAELANQKASE